MRQPHWMSGDLLPALDRAGVAAYDELRDVHRARVATLAGARRAEAGLRRRFAGEDAGVRDAMLAAARAGDDPEEAVAQRTSDASREVQLQVAAERVVEATEALCAGVLEASRLIGTVEAPGPVGEQLEQACGEMSRDRAVRVYDPARDHELDAIRALLLSPPENIETEVADVRAAIGALPAAVAEAPPVPAPGGRAPHPTPRELYWLHGALLPFLNVARVDGLEELKARHLAAVGQLTTCSSRARSLRAPGEIHRGDMGTVDAAEAEAVEAVCAVVDDVLEALADDLGERVRHEVVSLRERASDPRAASAPPDFEIEALKRLVSDEWRDELADQVADVRASLQPAGVPA